MRSPAANHDGYRTWRLAIAFFGGLGMALAWLDGMIAQRHNASWQIILWPCAHAVIVTAAAYWPTTQRLFRLALPQQRFSNRVVATIAAVIAISSYASAAWVSVAVLEGAVTSQSLKTER